jgi:hypothetical protein
LLTSGAAPQFSIQSSFVEPGTVNTDDCELWINNLSHNGIAGPPGGAFSANRTGWIATASVYNENANQSLDGDIETRWSTMSSKQVPGQWYCVDMLVPQNFNGIYLESNGNSYRPAAITVAVSNDSMIWTDVASDINVTLLAFEKQTARYLRITQTGTSSSSWRIADFTLLTPNFILRIPIMNQKPMISDCGSIIQSI